MYKLSLFHGIIVDPNNQNRVTVYPDPKTFDLPNCNYYYPDGTLIKVGSNSDHERQFAAKLDLECNLSRFEIKAFLDYHFNNTTSKDEFLNRLEYWVIPELLTGQNETRMAIIKEWLISKKDALIEDFPPRLKALSKPLPTQSPESLPLLSTKAERLREPLHEYGFFELEKVKVLPEENRERLIGLIADNELSYSIAMFDYLGFIKHLKKEHFTVSDKLNKTISKWFGKDKEGRNVKGNIYTLNARSVENRTRYTAHKHKETVASDYERLK